MTRPEVVEGNDNARFYTETWGVFFESRREPLIRWIMRRRNLQRHDAEEAYQDAVYKMLKKVSNLDGWTEPGLHTFLMKTLFRTAIDQWRHSNSRLRVRQAGDDVLEMVEARDELRALARECESLHKQASREAVEWGSQNLDPREWAIYIRSFTDGSISCDAIAKEFGLPLARVYRIRHQVAEKVRHRYGEILALLQTSFSAND
jgi:RNA polymerase sigma factor (sigma-70 family)